MKIGIIKFGGSLLRDSGCFQRFWDWYRTQAGLVDLIIAGGGAAVDAIRREQIPSGLTDEQCHWLSIGVMSKTAKELATGLNLADPICLEELLQCLSNEPAAKHLRELPVVIDVAEWLKANSRLPRSWAATSDSIAAEIASHVDANELTLLKSGLPESGGEIPDSVSELARLGYVDSNFPAACFDIGLIRCVNLGRHQTGTELVTG